MSSKPSPSAALRRALATVPEQPFVTRADLIAFGTALIELINVKKKDSAVPSEYVTLTALCRDYRAGRAQLSNLLSSHLVRKLALPTGGLRYHREDAAQYLTAHYSAQTSAPDHS